MDQYKKKVEIKKIKLIITPGVSLCNGQSFEFLNLASMVRSPKENENL